MSRIANIKRELFCTLSFILDRAAAEFAPLQGTLLINGFWRSGTTWVQEVLARAYEAKTIFEPMAPSSQFPLQERIFGKEVPQAWREAYIPLSADDLGLEDVRYLDKVFRGYNPTRSGFPYLCRKTYAECLSRRLVIKFVRAHCLLGFMSERYGLTPVNISRHPCAIVASFNNTDWSWYFSDVDLDRMYHRMDPYSDAVAERDRDTIRQYGNAAPMIKISALWALMERRVADTPGVVSMRYEDLARDPRRRFVELAQRAGVTLQHPLETENDSPVTVEGRKGVDIDARLNSWRHTLNDDEQQVIRRVVEAIWPEGAEAWFGAEQESVQ